MSHSALCTRELLTAVGAAGDDAAGVDVRLRLHVRGDVVGDVDDAEGGGEAGRDHGADYFDVGAGFEGGGDVCCEFFAAG
jgi:hypothetical protein